MERFEVIPTHFSMASEVIQDYGWAIMSHTQCRGIQEVIYHQRIP